jgi:putative polyhydroxyalkanoate system protein
MPDIHLERDHQLGLAKARRVARQWAEEAEQKFEMACHIVEGPEGDTVEFTRSGVKGALRVAADRFTLDAKLGFLLGAFSKTIEAEIEKNFDQLLRADRPAAKAAGKKK